MEVAGNFIIHMRLLLFGYATRTPKIHIDLETFSSAPLFVAHANPLPRHFSLSYNSV